MSDRMISRAALLDIRRDIEVFQQGHRFLDEKRMLIAQEILSRVEACEVLERRLLELHDAAVVALEKAVGLHGVAGVRVYPERTTLMESHAATETSFLGVPLLDSETAVIGEDPAPARRPALASAEAERCAEAFLAMLPVGAALSRAIANLKRLAADYTRTERRTRALEDILLPEMQQARRSIEEQLEEAERDEVSRIRWFSASTA